MDVPRLDLGAAATSPTTAAATARLAAQLDAGLRSTGFVLVAHPPELLPPAALDAAMGAARRLFALSHAQKAGLANWEEMRATLAGPRAPGFLSWLDQQSVSAEQRARVNNEYFGLDIGPLLDANPWPEEARLPQLAGFRAALEAYIQGAHAVFMRLLPILACALGVEPSFLQHAFHPPAGQEEKREQADEDGTGRNAADGAFGHSQCRLNCYPATATPETGLFAHTDGDFVTFLPHSPQVRPLHITPSTQSTCLAAVYSRLFLSVLGTT